MRCDRPSYHAQCNGSPPGGTRIFDVLRTVLRVDSGTLVEQPVHLCFGVTDREAVQRIDLQIQVGDGAKISLLAHCVFPAAEDVKHIMDADIRLGDGAQYHYLERHVHSDQGGVEVRPSAKIQLGAGSRFNSEFHLVRGRVGLIDMDYAADCMERSVLEMPAKIHGRQDDRITIRETGRLQGFGARGYLTSRIAVQDRAQAEIYSELTATAANARGHVDCKEIIKDNGVASAVPAVRVKHPQAHITHEAAIGSVDSKQLQTLMSRGLDEDRASDLIIAGLLR